MHTPEPPAVYTSAEAAARLGINRSTLTRRVQSGAIVPLKQLPGPRGAYLFDAQTIDRITAKQVAS